MAASREGGQREGGEIGEGKGNTVRHSKWQPLGKLYASLASVRCVFPVPVASYQLPRFLSPLIPPSRHLPTSLVLLLCATAKCVELHLCFVFPLPIPTTHTHIFAHRLLQSTCLHLQCRFIFVNLWWKNSHDEGKHNRVRGEKSEKEAREGKKRALSTLFYTLSKGSSISFILVTNI